MKHLDTELSEVRHKESRTSKKSRKATAWPTILLGLVLIVTAGGYGMKSLLGPMESDHVSNEQKVELATQFTKIRSIAVEPIKVDDIEAVLDGMRLDPASRRALKETLESPTTSGENTTLAKIVLWDSMAQDGDVVRVSSAGYAVDVPILKQHTEVVIPVDSNRSVQLSGVTDGGGGITVGIQSGDGLVALPVLTVGQVLNIPVGL